MAAFTANADDINSFEKSSPYMIDQCVAKKHVQLVFNYVTTKVAYARGFREKTGKDFIDASEEEQAEWLAAHNARLKVLFEKTKYALPNVLAKEKDQLKDPEKELSRVPIGLQRVVRMYAKQQGWPYSGVEKFDYSHVNGGTLCGVK